jgi:tripartite-type tricarboxylate transporter receptor subunit TctC
MQIWRAHLEIRRVATVVIAVAGISGFGVAATAQTYPEPGRPITLVNHFAAGGVNLQSVQDFAPFFEKYLGARVNIETIEGAAGLIGYNNVFGRPADGYTIIGASSTNGPYIYPHLAETPPPWKYEDWLTLGIYSDIPNSGMIVLKDSPYQTFPDFIAAAKADPDGITVGTIGPGRIEDVQIVELEQFFGIEVNRVFYDSGGTLFTDLLTGDLDVIVSTTTQYVDNPDVKVMTLLAYAMADNFPYQDLSTLADFQEELGYDVSDLKTLGTNQFNTFFVKAGLPDEAYAKLVDAMEKIVADPEWREQVKGYRYPAHYPPEQAEVIFDRINSGVAEMAASIQR